MTILIPFASYLFSDHLAGGENRVVWGIVKELDRRGHHLIVFAPRCSVRLPLRNTRAVEIGGYPFSPEQSYFRYRVDWWLYSIRAAWAAFRVLRRRQVDIVHHIRPAYLRRFSLAAALPAPFVYGPVTPVWENVDARDADPPTGRRGSMGQAMLLRLLRLVEKAAVPHLWDLTLTRARAILTQIPRSAEGLPPTATAKIHQVGLATEPDLFYPSETPPSRPTVLFLAKLNRRKGLDYLLQAIPRVAERVPEVLLRVVGDGPAMGHFRATAESLNLGDLVRFDGAVPHAEAADCYRNASIFCLPSVGEPAANTLLEAMASGLPIVATDAGGVPEIVEDGKGGILVPPRDPEALADALCRILTDQSLAREMRTHNRARCLEAHDVVGLVDRIEQVYLHVTGAA
jgi:glycosyltransferase involved in cell wall biosynthesis